MAGRPVRRGGRATLDDGALLTWSLAEGSRGRRWRASRARNGRLEGTLLLEVDGSGRPARLEVGTVDGLLTLHPHNEERELHGNVVTPTGIRHLSFAWSPAHELVVEGYPVVGIAALRRLRSTATEGAGGASDERPAVIVDAALDCRPGTLRLAELGSELAVDADGAPAGLTDALDWPLEA